MGFTKGGQPLTVGLCVKFSSKNLITTKMRFTGADTAT